MSAEAITDGLARHFKENVAGIKGAYASSASGTANVLPLPTGIPDTPIVIVYWQRYRLEGTAPEKVRHYLDADVYVAEVDTASAYKLYLPFVSLVIASLRTNSTLYHTCTIAEAVSGGPPIPEVIDSKPYVRLPFQIEAIEFTPVSTYT